MEFNSVRLERGTYRVAMKVKAMMMFEEMTNKPISNLMKNGTEANEVSITDMVKLVYCSLENAKKWGPFNEDIQSIEDLEDFDMEDISKLAKASFETMNTDKAKKIRPANKVGKQTRKV